MKIFLFCLILLNPVILFSAQAPLGNDPDIIGLYHLNEGSGSNYRDSSTNSGKIGDMGDCNAGNAWVTGKYGTGINSAGGGSVGGIEISVAKGITVTNYTIMAWVKMSKGTTDRSGGIFKAGSSPYFGLNIINNGLESSNNVDTEQAGTANVISTGVWTHCAMVRNTSTPGTQIKLYVNGRLDVSFAKGAGGSGGITTNSRRISIGAVNTGDGGTCSTIIPGTIDEVIIWNRALDDGEIEQYYWAGIHGGYGEQ